MNPTLSATLSQKEIDYDMFTIKKLTPYLDHILVPKQGKANLKKPLSAKERAMAWYYIYNNNNKADAWKRAFWGKLNENTLEIDIIIPKGKEKSFYPYVRANYLFKNTYIKECIRLINNYHTESLLQEHRQSYIEQLTVRAYYDPAIFYDNTGKLKPLADIPDKYRCCIDGISRKRYGKDGDYLETEYTLASRDKARGELVKLTPDIAQGNKTEIVHKTINTAGTEMGIDVQNFDPTKLTDAQLSELANKVKEI